ncbi:MAG: LysR family transcriptional regulator [Methyloceanibacter sp.]|nr:LysR family transcriptional regulator [Methyloceanibacter sp.]
MDLKQLSYFKAVAEELHFQRAARRVHLTQPALSHQIKALERELGVTLLERDRKSVALTAAGGVLLEHTKLILRQVEVAKQETQEVGGSAPKRLLVATIDYLNLDVITRSLMKMRSEHPEVEIQKTEMPTNEVFNAVKEQAVDIGFGPPPVPHDALIKRRVALGHWTLVLPRDHELTIQESVSLAELRDQPLIIFDRALNPDLYDWWMQQFAAAGYKPNVVMETKQIQAALSMVKDGLALYIIASFLISDLSDSLTLRPLSGFDTEMSVFAAWREDYRNPALKFFLEYIRQLA